MSKDPFASLVEFTPRKKEDKTGDVKQPEIRALNEEHGFSINNLEEKRNLFRVRRKPRAPKTEAITMRVRIAAYNKFQRYCEESGDTVAEAFDKLTEFLPQPGTTVQSQQPPEE